MNKPYFLERWRIAKAQSEDRRDFEDMVNYEADKVAGGDDDDEQTENQSETVEV